MCDSRNQGIPEHILQEQEQRNASATPAAPQAATATGTTSTASGEDEPVNLFEAAAQAGTEARGGARGTAAAGGGEGGAESLPNLDFLRQNPHFQQLRQLVQQQPQMLEPILQQVGAGNPQIAHLIGQNEEQFLQLLSEEVESAPPPVTTQISVTEAERDAIERVCQMFVQLNFLRLIKSSFADLASSGTWSSKPTLHATRTRSSLQTIYLTTPTPTTHNVVLVLSMMRNYPFLCDKFHSPSNIMNIAYPQSMSITFFLGPDIWGNVPCPSIFRPLQFLGMGSVLSLYARFIALQASSMHPTGWSSL